MSSDITDNSRNLPEPRIFNTERAQRLNQAATIAATHLDKGLAAHRIILAYADWLIHLGLAPGKVAQLVELRARQLARLSAFALRGGRGERCIEPEASDGRFKDEGWRKFPFSILEQDHLLRRQWWDQATRDISGLSRHDATLVSFFSRYLVDGFSPYNFPLTNPQVLRATREQNGLNFIRGARNFVRDKYHSLIDKPPKELEAFKVGEHMATTPGKVVYRNRLIELIRYKPKTEKVHPEPVLIVPAWIMKYYILDLTKGKSLVEYLLEQGHTVFIISWKNPDKEDAGLGMDDYRLLGPMAALDAVGDMTQQHKIHAMGYCVGGTLMSITAATMARDGDDRLASLSLLAAQTDFTLAGELRLFIDAAQLGSLEAQMAHNGFLKKEQMAGAFFLLRANDLMRRPIVEKYMLGNDMSSIPLMAWNADATRMPHRMHIEYLRRLYLENQLSAGTYEVDSRPIAIRDINVPLFIVGTETDHVAPWRSVYKTCLLSRTEEQVFLLTTGGHNAGIVTPPGHPRRRFRMDTHRGNERYISPGEWYDKTPEQQGSWWPAWQDWLASHSGDPIDPPQMAETLCDAPGTYIYER